MSESPCPDSGQLLNYMNGPLDEAQEQEFDAHFETCSPCQARFRRMADVQPERSNAPVREHLAHVSGYHILHSIGEGGMGTVFAAEQIGPIRRHVALKMIRPGMETSAEVLARFEQERRTLAMMDHPNIATVFDAGVSEDGLPYFVMEHLSGLTITRYVEEHCLSIHQSIELFLPVLRAVQHAHAKGVIHRDLKPSNILVCTVDGRAVPKVIDFGLARAVRPEGSPGDGALRTQLHAFIGTLLYASPEQGEGSADIDTRSDIYSLGVVLYELLTGTTPIEAAIARDKPIDQLLHLLKHTDPPRPSLRVSKDASAPESDSIRRSQRQRVRSLKSELDWIVMKALEKHPGRRYETAASFADDLSRYLADTPVRARPPSLTYRVGKFVRRYRWGVAAATTLVVLLLIGLAVTTTFYRRADANRGLAQEQAELAIDALNFLVTEVNQKLATVPEAGPARQRLVRATLSRLSKIDTALAGRAVVDRTAMQAAQLQGDLYIAIRESPSDGSRLLSDQADSALRRAVRAYQRAVQMARELEIEQPMDESRQVDLATSLEKLAECQLPLDSSTGLATLEEVDRYTQASLSAHPKSKALKLVRAECLNELGDFWWRRRRNTPKSLSFFREGEELARRLVEDYPGDVECRYALLIAIGGLRSHAIEVRNITKALQYDKECFGICERWCQQPADPSEMQQARHALAFANLRLGESLHHYGSYSEAVGPLRNAIDYYEAFLQRAPFHRGARVNLYFAYRDLGDDYKALGDEDALAEQAFQKTLDEAETLVGDVPDNLQYQTYLSIALERLAEHLLTQNENYESLRAMALLERKLVVDQKIVDSDDKNDRSHRDLSIAHEFLAVAYWLQGSMPAAGKHLRDMLSIREALFARVPSDPEIHEDYLTALLIMGCCEHGSDDLRGKAGFEELGRLRSGLQFVWQTGKLTIENRQGMPDDKKPSGEMLFSAARALTYCVQALQSDRIAGPRAGAYADPKNQAKLLEVATGCLREYRRGDHADLTQLRATFTGTPLAEHPGFAMLLEDNP